MLFNLTLWWYYLDNFSCHVFGKVNRTQMSWCRNGTHYCTICLLTPTIQQVAQIDVIWWAKSMVIYLENRSIPRECIHSWDVSMVSTVWERSSCATWTSMTCALHKSNDKNESSSTTAQLALSIANLAGPPVPLVSNLRQPRPWSSPPECNVENTDYIISTTMNMTSGEIYPNHDLNSPLNTSGERFQPFQGLPSRYRRAAYATKYIAFWRRVWGFRGRILECWEALGGFSSMFWSHIIHLSPRVLIYK